MTRLLVIRHAATDWNEARLIQGRADRPLSDAGRSSLDRLRLPTEWKNATCRSSPLRRAMETAHLLGLEPQPDQRLIEMDWGQWEGRRLADLRTELGIGMAENEARGLDFRPPGGESPRDVQQRLKPFLSALSEPTVVVTHRGVLRALYALATGWDMTAKAPDKLVDGRTHVFAIAPRGTLAIEQLNLSLEDVA